MSSQTLTEIPAISVTALAADKIRGLMAERNLSNVALRVFVSGGGCSGMQYGMAFEPNPRESDTEITPVEGVRVVVDPSSLPYLLGANIDFVDTMMGGGFKIDNPNAVSSCGCGNSFRTSEGGEAHAHEGGSCGCH